jgi:hypothetical protein
MPLYNPQGTAPLTILSSTSATKTNSGSNNWNSMSGGSIALTPGTWELSAGFQHQDSGGASGLSLTAFSIFGSNGADSASVPTLLSATANLTINGAFPADGIVSSSTTTTASVRSSSSAFVIVTVTATVTVYAVALGTVTTAANSRFITTITGRRIY